MNNASDKPAAGWKAGTASGQSTNNTAAKTYRKAVAMMERASTAREYRAAAKLFYGIASYGDSQHKLSICLKCARDLESDQQKNSYSASGRGRLGSAASTSTRDTKKSTWVEGKCPICGNDIYVDADKERFNCPKCYKDASTKTAISYKSWSLKSTGPSSSQPFEPSPTAMQSASSSRPSTGKAIGFGFLCYAIIASIVTFTSIFVFQAMGYSVWIGPNLISLAIGAFFGVVYKTTGKASSLVMFSVLIGLALGFALPYFVVSMH